VPQNLGIWRSTVAKNTAFMPAWALVSRQGYRRQMLDDAQKQPLSVRRDPETNRFFIVQTIHQGSFTTPLFSSSLVPLLF
jgi:hypothetical protein